MDRSPVFYPVKLESHKLDRYGRLLPRCQEIVPENRNGRHEPAHQCGFLALSSGYCGRHDPAINLPKWVMLLAKAKARVAELEARIAKYKKSEHEPKSTNSLPAPMA